jgi:hypothetical protein
MITKSYGVKLGKKAQEKADIETVKKLKPELRKFVVNEQIRKAKQTAEAEKKEREEKLSRSDIINRCSQLAVIAYLDKKYWEQAPLPFEMAWVTGKSFSGKVLNDQERQNELQIDVSGFSKYLLEEYIHMEKDIKALRYRNPLQEENLPFFWNKFLMDLRLLIKADSARVAMGNKGAIVQEKMSSGIVLPNGVKQPNKKNDN